METPKNKNLMILVLGSLAVALSFVLSSFCLFKMPFGGSVTMASSSPLIVFSLMFGHRYGLCASACYSFLQIISGFYAPPVKNVISLFAVLMLDYFLPYASLGFADIFSPKLKLPFAKALISAIALGGIRYALSFLSGVLVWRDLAPASLSVWQYSLIYNAVYIVPETILNSLAAAVIFAVLKSREFYFQ